LFLERMRNSRLSLPFQKDMEAYSVRSLIRYFELGKLKKDKILPSSSFFMNVKKDAVFGKLSDKIGYSEFGLLVEKWVEYIIQNTPTLEELEEYIYQLSPAILFKPVEKEALAQLNTMLTEHFISKKDIRFQEEWRLENNLQGHPDIIAGDTIYDIKTTNYFQGMRVETILQLLSYFAMANKLFPCKYKKIGLILPSQLQIITIDVSKWDSSGFLDIMIASTFLEEDRRNRYRSDMNGYESFMRYYQENIGTHIRKEDLIKTVESGFQKPLQFFANGNMTGKVEMEKGFQSSLKKITKFNPFIFIHSPYCFNLSNPWGNSTREEDNSQKDECDRVHSWTSQRLIYLLQTGKECGLKGIVVHCGQYRKENKAKGLPEITEDDAMAEMFLMIEGVAEYASEECPLLIETPAGETGETFSNKFHFINMFLCLQKKYKNKVKMCVDTCHVFAASYNPVEYVEDVLKNGVDIGLIHYNDSWKDCGSRKDLHAHPKHFHGFIGLDILLKVMLVAAKEKIPCVRE
jgi:endonuclease IV